MRIKADKTINDFIEMERLELKYYSDEHVTPFQEAYRWHLANPYTGFVIEDLGKIIGFTDILPIHNEIFDEILSGTFNDKYLTTDHLINMNLLKEGDTVNLLLSCVVIHEDYRRTEALKMLLDSHLDYYRNYIDKGIRIESVITSNVTVNGERFSERMGFQRVGKSEHGTTLYITSFRQFDERVRSMKSRLKEHQGTKCSDERGRFDV